MPAPVWSVPADTRYGVRQVAKFGGLPIPIVGGTQAYIDLMDGANWFLDPRQSGVDIKIDHRLISTPYAWRAKSALQSEDYFPCTVLFPILSDETNGIPFHTARGPLFTFWTQNPTSYNPTS